MKRVDILFCVDATSQIGMGHISRSLELNEHIVKKNPKINTAFLSFVDDLALKILKGRKVNFLRIKNHQKASEFQKILTSLNPKMIINDKWNVNTREYLKVLRDNCDYLIILDDFKNGQIYADALINSLPCTYAINPKREGLEFFKGLKYLILQEKGIESFSRQTDILVILGSRGTKTLSIRLAELLAKKFPAKKFSVVSDIKRSSLKNLKIIPPFAKKASSLISRHRLVITSGGMTMFEAVFLKKSVFAISTQTWEKKNIRYLEKLSAVKYLGNYSDPLNTITRRIVDYMNKNSYVNKKSYPIDGLGLQRVTKIILNYLK